MWSQIGYGALMAIVTGLVHAVPTALALRALRKVEQMRHTHLRHSAVLSLLMLGLFLFTFIESLLWALVYLRVGAIGQLEEALYFSMVTFTTLGYGDITLDSSWRLLASFEAGTGILIFGWSTAIVVAYMQRLASYHHGHRHDHGDGKAS